MRLTFKRFDGRGMNFVPIIDADTGEEVGRISSGGVGFGNIGGISISLFGDRYRAEVNRYDECRGFVKGVEVVLNHLAGYLTDTYNPVHKERGTAA